MPYSHNSVGQRSACGVKAVCAAPRHGFSKQPQDAIELLQDLGVNNDAHCGATVRHIFDVRRSPGRRNLRQVHLIEAELLAGLKLQGFEMREGLLGENVTISGIALDSLPRLAQLHLGATAIIEITGLRAPCVKMDRCQRGLRAAVTARSLGGWCYTRGGAMGIVVRGGVVRAGDEIRVGLPDLPHRALELV
jgi:MOSC domain-containing protein YiiM